MAARNFEDLLQCAIPVFDDLLPRPHDTLHMHSDLTLDILDQTTTELGKQFRRFKANVCTAYDARELDKEVNTRSRRQAKEAARQTQAGKGKNPSKHEDKPDGMAESVERNVLHRKVSLNLHTYKFHSLGDYALCIRRLGTTDSYSTEAGELEHRTGKQRYLRTDRKTFVHQLTQIERHQTRIRRIKNHLQQSQSHEAADSDPTIHHHIGLSEKINDNIGSHLRLREGDPAMKNYFSRLKDHLLQRVLSSQFADLDQAAHGDINQILFKRNRIFHHNIACINYTTYDTRRDQDVINPKTSHCNIMVLSSSSESGHYHYANVLGIHHVNTVVVRGSYQTPHQMEFLFVRWYEAADADSCRMALDHICFSLLDSEGAFGFLNPVDVLRASHIIPHFSKGMHHADGRGLSGMARDRGDWQEYFVNRFVDRDMLMRFHYGLGVGHVYSHQDMLPVGSPSDVSSPQEITVDGREGDEHEEIDSENSEYEPTGVEEEVLFDQEQNGSTESIIEELDNMFTIEHKLDYES
ncbi:uncharacterized protein EDB91DRAFT_1254209 [Suillus paluster]|uniref:uncharacterized protein n=1 Tax=Suillus paluster TaxID=48578 RepID=UPI001B86986D|nr:uncharacterized protein EDB91DRAFT_1254209 [Suillus paluster]KAG1726708.1 hypothetical protein EDB91DRAFT_1254209 [Suillus paluster]